MTSIVGKSKTPRTSASQNAARGRAAAPTSSQALVPAPEHTPNATEKLSLDAHLSRRRKAKPIPKQIIEYVGGVANLKDDHPDPAIGASLTMEALGLTRVHELTALLQHLVDLSQKDRRAEANGINQLLAQVASIEPSDGIEAMLATQMVAIHNAAMKAARLLRGSETIPQQDSNGRLLNGLARTFAAQTESLKRYRSKGLQRVVIEHQNNVVEAGGQAVFGDVVPRDARPDECQSSLPDRDSNAK